MKRLFLFMAILIYTTSVYSQSYTTQFPATENPISQSGKWVNGLATGLDWGNVQTIGNGTSGTAYGTTISLGPPFNDSIATINGTWGLDQTVTGTVVGCSGANIGVFKEISIFLRFNITAHTAKGLGADWSCENANNGQPYHEFGSWCGPINDFAGSSGNTCPTAPSFHVGNGPGNGVVNGDVISVSLIGNVVTMTKNGVVQVQSGVNGAPFDNFDTAAGSPGIGFYLQSGTASATAGMLTDHGLTNVTATTSVIAASCSANDVATALSKVTTDGETVVIPACPSGFSWGAQTAFTPPGGNGNASVDANGQVTYFLGFSTEIIGAGNTIGSDSLGNPTGYNDQTVLIYNNPAGTSVIHPQWSTNGKYLRMSGLTINGGTGVSTNGVINFFGPKTQAVNCTWPTGSDGGLTSPVVGPCLRFDHNHLHGLNNVAGEISGWLYGVADHNVMEFTAADSNGFKIYTGGYNNETANFGNNSWADVENWGSGNFFFLENNLVTNSNLASISTINDCFEGGREVIRYNTMGNGGGNVYVQHHPTGNDGRGCRATEIYKNIANESGCTSGGCYNFHVNRAGNSIVWGNNVTGYGVLVNIWNDRVQAEGRPVSGYNFCNGSNVWDGNSLPSGAPCLDYGGRGKGDVFTGEWSNGGTVLNATQGNIQAWPRQASSPVYVWGNTLTTTPTYMSAQDGAGYFAENRDYYLELPNINEPAATFNGTAGIGCGAGATAGAVTSTCAHPIAQPATCTAGSALTTLYNANSPGVGYWNTASNTLFVCTATNTWTSYYVPFTYPHPLAGGAGVAGPVPVPTNFFGLSIFGTPVCPSNVCNPATSYPLQDSVVPGTLGKVGFITGYNIEATCDGGTNPSNACYNWSNLDTWVNWATSHGYFIVYDWDNTPPGWQCGLSPTTQRCTVLPSSLSFMSNFATALATRYAGKIKYYETNDEVNNPGVWTDTCANLVLLHNTMYTAIKAGDPTALVGAPNMGFGATTACASSPTTGGGAGNEWIWLQNFLQTRDSNGNLPHVDTVGEHFYNRTTPPLLTVAQRFLDLYNHFRSVMTAAGISTSQPLLVSEGSFGPDTTSACAAPLNTTACLSSADQVAYIGRWLVLAASTFSDGGGMLGNWYQYDSSTGTLNGTLGMNPQNSSAYGQMEGWLSGALFLSQCHTGTPSTVFVCDFTNAAGQANEIIFNENGGATATYTVPAFAKTFQTLLGTPTTITGGTVTVGNTPILLTAGVAVSITPGSLNFGTQPIGVTSSAQTLTIQNIGTANVTWTAFSTTQPSGTTFNDTAGGGTCSVTNATGLAPGASCTVRITGLTNTIGTQNGTFNFPSNAPNSPQTVALSITGGTPNISLSTTSITFGNQNLLSTGAPQIVTVTSTGNVNLIMGTPSATISGDFSLSTPTGACTAALSLPNASTCTFTVSFTPTAIGTRSGTLSIFDNVTGSPQLVSLNGIGIQVAPASQLFAWMGR